MDGVFQKVFHCGDVLCRWMDMDDNGDGNEAVVIYEDGYLVRRDVW